MGAGHDGTGVGTTSACAENTPRYYEGTVNQRNYLRVRGEYNFTTQAADDPQELPPRARRIRCP